MVRQAKPITPGSFDDDLWRFAGFLLPRCREYVAGTPGQVGRDAAMTIRHPETREDSPFRCQTMRDFRDIRAEEPISPGEFSAVRRSAVLGGCKWDPQVGDTETL